MRTSGSKVMATKITRDVLESYLNCKTKAHLKLAGHQGSMSDYEGLLVASRQEVRQRPSARSSPNTRRREVARDILLTAAALRAGPSFVLDAALEDDLLSLRRRAEEGRWAVEAGNFHYVPMLFHEGRKVGKEQRLPAGTVRACSSHGCKGKCLRLGSSGTARSARPPGYV